MTSGLDAHTDPVFWWWEEDDQSRVVLLTDTVLIVSGRLTDAGLAELEEARRAGTVESADFGSDASRVTVDEISWLRYVPDTHRLEVEVADGRRVDVAPPRTKAGVALGVFDTLAKRLAPDREPVDSHIDGEKASSSDPTLTVVGAMVVMGLVCLGLAVAADQAEPTGPLAGIRSALSDIFSRVGYLPALALFVVAAVVQFHRMRSASAEQTGGTAGRPARVLELDLRPDHVRDSAVSASPDAAQHGPADELDSRVAVGASDEGGMWAAAAAPTDDSFRDHHEDAAFPDPDPAPESDDWSASDTVAAQDAGWQPPVIGEAVDPRVPVHGHHVSAEDGSAGGWFEAPQGAGAGVDDPAPSDTWQGPSSSDTWASDSDGEPAAEAGSWMPPGSPAVVAGQVTGDVADDVGQASGWLPDGDLADDAGSWMSDGDAAGDVAGDAGSWMSDGRGAAGDVASLGEVESAGPEPAASAYGDAQDDHDDHDAFWSRSERDDAQGSWWEHEDGDAPDDALAALADLGGGHEPGDASAPAWHPDDAADADHHDALGSLDAQSAVSFEPHEGSSVDPVGESPGWAEEPTAWHENDVPVLDPVAPADLDAPEWAESEPVGSFEVGPVESSAWAESEPVESFEPYAAGSSAWAESEPGESFEVGPVESSAWAASEPVGSFEMGPVESFEPDAVESPAWAESEPVGSSEASPVEAFELESAVAASVEPDAVESAVAASVEPDAVESSAWAQPEPVESFEMGPVESFEPDAGESSEWAQPEPVGSFEVGPVESSAWAASEPVEAFELESAVAASVEPDEVEPSLPEPVESYVPEPIASSEPEVRDEWSTAPSRPAPDSPFAEILDREAPLPPWATAPEPVSDVVDRDAMERSIPVSLRPQSAELD